MSNRRTTRLFFVELVFVLLSFALCTAVCVQLFAKAHEKSSLSRETAAAVSWAQTAAECFKSAPDDEQKLASLLCADMQNGTATVYYSDTWVAVREQASRTLTLITHREGSLITADITVSLGSRVLFTLTVCHAVTKGGDVP